MKALMLIQPWASLIALGEKQYETRSWVTTYRGPIAIHAGRRTPQAESFINKLIHEFPFPFGKHSIEGPNNLPFGCIIVVARLVDCKRTERLERISWEEIAFGDWSPGRWAWRLSEIRGLDQPVPVRGAQGLWDVPGGFLARLRLSPVTTRCSACACCR